ncbi:hypothetical protein [Vulcanococcus limneticus]|uniref:hypothetical protein n=1 Tax=Vulcanococcus limneticus TaxID=2170428 RepID=UPI00398C0F77
MSEDVLAEGPYGPAKRNPDGTFGSLEHANDPWDILPVSMRRSLKQRIVAHTAARNTKTAVWARDVLVAAMEADQADPQP